MAVMGQRPQKTVVPPIRISQRGKGGRNRLARELYNGRFQPGETLKLTKLAPEYGFDAETIFRLFVEFQTMGLAMLTANKIGRAHV